MTVRMSSTEDTSAHKRNASATSAVQTTPPPAKRLPPPTASSSVASLPPSRREFPHTIALVLYSDGGADGDIAAATTVMGAFAALADANAEVRRISREYAVHGGDGMPEPAADNAGKDVNPARWNGPEGNSCWVELHAVTPKSIVPKSASASPQQKQGGDQQQKKLYDSDEGEDPDLDDELDEGGHYD
ncbi:hypothetical protein CTAM01_09765 [Colletotrichum tamarilloi]|uniref:Uncharacterized protein n=1 Tax=Colletotrichum tamarilloi TaxID=1209934 RepID=A0ABQ9R2H4_9PEZI|nr:uncharacterized protein CTAM01_09765 [Colletotrichum tamarilloi]KAK1492814.1 hypothetical protein CTAM01_09765 [Colletotrichum tamarilloi]